MLDHETVRQKLQTSQEAREKESFGALTRMRLFMANAHGIRHEQSHQCSSVIVRLNWLFAFEGVGVVGGVGRVVAG